MLRIVVTGIVVMMLSGCAGYRLNPISQTELQSLWNDQGGRRAEEGYIIYEPAPFLIGTLKEQAANQPYVLASDYTFKIEYLPDHSRPYRFTQYEVLAKSELKVTFANGWQFTGAESKTDSTAALTALVELAKTISPMDMRQNVREAPSLVMFRIVVNGAQTTLQPVTLPTAR